MSTNRVSGRELRPRAVERLQEALKQPPQTAQGGKSGCGSGRGRGPGRGQRGGRPEPVLAGSIDTESKRWVQFTGVCLVIPDWCNPVQVTNIHTFEEVAACNSLWERCRLHF
jgi:hypothetical protein